MKFTFTSTTLDGKDFTISANQNGQSAGPVTVNNWNAAFGTDTPEVHISIFRSPTPVAPEGIFFDANVAHFNPVAPANSREAHDPTKTEIVYRWTIEKYDENGQFVEYKPTYSLPEKLYDGHRDASRLFGSNVAHVFETPGNYRVSVIAVDPAALTEARNSITFTVADPEQLYANANTFYIHPQGNFTAAPAGALNFSSLSDAFNAARGKTHPLRIMLEDDQTYLGSDIRTYGNMPSILLTRSGTGVDRPRISYDFANPTGEKAIFRDTGHGRQGERQFTMNGLDFFAGWDPVTETFDPAQPLAIDLMFHSGNDSTNETTARFFLAHKCKARGFKNTWRSGHTRRLYSEVDVSDWQDYGLFINDKEHMGVIGSSIVQNPSARSGGDKNNPPTNNNHGPLRMSSNIRTVLDGNEFFSRNGWSAIGDGEGNNYRSEQPCIRWNQNMRDVGIGNIQRNRMEGGRPIIAVAPVNKTTAPIAQSLLIERNEFIGSHMTQASIALSASGVTVRNNHFTQPNVMRLSSSMNPYAFVYLNEHAEPSSEATAEPVRIHHNTMVSLMEASNYFGTGYDAQASALNSYNSTVFSDVVEESDLLHCPNASPPLVTYAPLQITARPDARHAGYYTQEHPWSFPGLQATPLNSLAFWTPDETSQAAGQGDPEGNGALQMHIWGDFKGDQRPMVASIGAFEDNSI